MKAFKVTVNWGALKESGWYQFAVRFAFGGAVTAITGIIAKRFGPEVGGLFLAFPAIFPAGATLIETHEKEKKQKAGFAGTNRGREAAGLDAAGAALGSFGLIAFALVVFGLLPLASAWIVLLVATFAWMLVSGILWYLRKIKPCLRTTHPLPATKHKTVSSSRR